MEYLFFPSINRLYVTHPQKATDHTVLLVYNTSMGITIFIIRLPGWCVDIKKPPLTVHLI